MISDVAKKKVINREKPISTHLPYTVHLDATTIRTKQKDLMRIFRIAGVAHESADDDDLNVWLEQLNILLRNLASTNVALWTHTIRRVKNDYPSGDFEPGFARDFDAKYKQSLHGTRMLVNELYVTVIYRPQPVKALKLLDRFRLQTEGDMRAQLGDDMAKLDDLGEQIKASLSRYEPTILSTYQHSGRVYSELLEFLAYLVNGYDQRMPVPRGLLADVIGTSRPFFGAEAIELRGPETSIVCGIVGIKEYPSQTAPGMLNGLLSAPYEFILCQSFAFLSKQAATGRLGRQRDRLISAGDLAETQIAELSDALDDITSNRFVFGDHNLSLQVRADTVKALSDSLASARAILSDCGMVIAREDVALEAAFWAQLPCNFAYRARPAAISSRNFAGLASMHNYPTGNAGIPPKPNHWGPAVALLKTASGGPYYFNFHLHDLGNTTIIGPSGTGKTVLQGFLVAQLEKFRPKLVFFDKDRGAEIFVRAQGGYYMPLQTGRPTGFNPFQLPLTPEHEQFLQKLIRALVAPAAAGLPYSVRDEKNMAAAIKGVYGLPHQLRRISQVLSFLDPTDPDGVRARLAKWCHGGQLAWVFDNETDALDFNRHRLYGFDITEFLDNPETRTPIILYLFQRMEQLITGQRFVCFIDEFWKAMGDEAFQDFAKNKLKTIRKQNGFLVTGTQSPSDTLKSPIAKTVIEQSPTKIFMPNAAADHDDYVEGFKLTEREFEIIRTLHDKSRRFLIKQGHNSVVAELNLKGFEQELAVLSGTTANVELVNRIITEVGADPRQWLPKFYERRVAA